MCSGYMPPEYVQQGHFSFKSDVFGFGVLLLEIITGQRINSYYNAKTGETLLCFVSIEKYASEYEVQLHFGVVISYRSFDLFRDYQRKSFCLSQNLLLRGS